MLAVGQSLVLALLLPRVENPWPETIGIGLPFAIAGAGGVLAGALYVGDSKAGHDRDSARRNLGLSAWRVVLRAFLSQPGSIKLMKRIVRLKWDWQGMLIGCGSLLLIGIVQQETVVSYMVVAGLAALLFRNERIRRRKERTKA